jgi:nucleoside-diphosphate-sugar epimerase
MLDALRRTSFSGIYWRLLGDFMLIHVCLILALAFAVTSYTVLGLQSTAQEIAGYFPRYYGQFFWPLSAVFPLVFLFSGLYTRSRIYTPHYRAVAILRAAGLAILLFLAGNYMVFRDNLVSRSVAIWFSVLLTMTLIAVHLGPAKSRNIATDAPDKSRRGHREPNVVLVVGGAGYIGSIVVRRLLESGAKVRLLDRLVYGYASIEDIMRHPNLDLVVGDCRNIQTVVGAVKGAKAIIDLAAIVGDPACEEDRQTALETNYAATRMLIEVAKGQRIRRFLFASSCSVYGATEVIADEQSEVCPISLYAQTKIDSERALLRARNEFFHPTILRLATVFGFSYRPRFDLVVNLLAAKAFQEGVITIFNGSQWRPFIHVRDAAESILHLLHAPLGVVDGQVFNVGSPHMNYTLTQVAEKIREAFPQTRVEYVENADRRNYRVSFQKLRSQTGFECTRSLEEGIRELKQAFDEKRVVDYKAIYYDNRRFIEAVGASTHTDEIDARVMAAFADAQGQSWEAPPLSGVNGGLVTVSN